MKAEISVIICTRNRAESPARTLISISSCNPPPNVRAEIVVVENGSTDNTPSVIERFTDATIPVRRVAEPVAGQTRARNRGIASTEGEVLLWTDDDVVVVADPVSETS